MKKAKPQNAPHGVIARERTDARSDSRLSEPERTLTSSRRLFCNQAREKYQSCWEVRGQIQAVVAARPVPIVGLTMKHEIFRSGLREWLELVVKLATVEVGRLSRIGRCHPTWLGNSDPAQWARINVQEFLRGFLHQEVSTHALATAFLEGTSLLKFKDDPPSSTRPMVEKWFRKACEGPKDHSWPRSTKPWHAPVWCFEDFSEPWWIKLGRPSRLIVDDTKGVIRSAQSDFAGRLEYVLREAEDLQRVECASLGSTHTDSSLRDPKTSILNSAVNRFVPTCDYRSVLFEGKQYTLTRNQATIVKTLHRAREAGPSTVGTDTLLAAIEAETSRVCDSFKNSPLWGTLVVRGEKRGTYKLSL